MRNRLTQCPQPIRVELRFEQWSDSALHPNVTGNQEAPVLHPFTPAGSSNHTYRKCSVNA